MERKAKLKGNMLTIIDGASLLLAMILNLTCLKTIKAEDVIPMNTKAELFATMMMLVISSAAGYIKQPKENKYDRMNKLIQGLFFAAGAVVCIAFLKDQLSVSILSVLVLGVLLCGRIFSILKNRNIRSYIFNGIIIIAVIYIGTYLIPGLDFEGSSDIPADMINDSLIIFLGLIMLMVIIAGYLMLRIMALSLGRFRLDILWRIAERSMAAEIIGGLVLLIMAVSLVLTMVEPAMSKFVDALWYCFALVTTIGFGDITAVTAVGRALSVVLGIYGIVVVALITSIIVNFYSEIKSEEGKDQEMLPDNADKEPLDSTAQKQS